jgi:transposase
MLLSVNAEQLFATALGLSSPWIVTDSQLIEGELHLNIDFAVGARFDGKPVHDTVQRSWRHLNFWQYPTYLHARVPRVIGEDGSVCQVDVPWARPGSGFTAMFEALALLMMRDMPMSKVAQTLGVDDMRLWRMAERAVESARESADFSGVTRVGVDETSCKKRHDYISLFVDLDSKRVLFACKGRASTTLGEFKKDLVKHGGNPKSIKSFSCDMSPAFLSGIKKHFPKAEIVLDKFHLVKMLSEAVDQTRRSETKHVRMPKGARFLWLKNPNRLSDSQKQTLSALQGQAVFTKTAEAYRLRLAFQELFHQPLSKASHYLATWLDAALDSGVGAIEEVAQTFFQKRDLILNWFKHRVNNGILEGLNSVLQSAKNRARGYGNPDHMILMSYLLHSKLNLDPRQIQRRTRKLKLDALPT